jgi:queuine/archaeosine tRNA-ribosyltransferase
MKRVKYLTLGGRRMRTPFFAATVSEDPRLWPWRRGLQPDALLVSYDVLGREPGGWTAPVARTLDFERCVIVDSGAYGASSETRPTAIDDVQQAVGANVGVVLDKVALSSDPRRRQWEAVRRTIRNAMQIRRRHHRTMSLEAVVQGATPDQLHRCARALAALGFAAYGVPVSMQSKRRNYAAAVERVASAAAGLPSNAAIHALGCGSRTLMAVLSYIGVTSFDSRSYYQRAAYGENFTSVTMCAAGEPRNNPGCDACRSRRPPGRTLETRTDHNLDEVLKEIQRIRCALQVSRMESYLQRRLSKRLFSELSLLIERLAPHRRLRDGGAG